MPSVPTHYIYQFANTKDIIDDSKIVITTYDLLVRAVDTFQCKIFGFVILVCYKYVIYIYTYNNILLKYRYLYIRMNLMS